MTNQRAREGEGTRRADQARESVQADAIEPMNVGSGRPANLQVGQCVFYEAGKPRRVMSQAEHFAERAAAESRGDIVVGTFNASAAGLAELERRANRVALERLAERRKLQALAAAVAPPAPRSDWLAKAREVARDAEAGMRASMAVSDRARGVDAMADLRVVELAPVPARGEVLERSEPRALPSHRSPARTKPPDYLWRAVRSLAQVESNAPDLLDDASRWDWIKEHGSDVYDAEHPLPTKETWIRYARGARKAFDSARQSAAEP